MVPFVPLMEIAGCAVEQGPVCEVLESVPVNQAQQQSQRPAIPSKQPAPQKDSPDRQGSGLAAENFPPAHSNRLLLGLRRGRPRKRKESFGRQWTYLINCLLFLLYCDARVGSGCDWQPRRGGRF